jgi:hypothetical protein
MHAEDHFFGGSCEREGCLQEGAAGQHEAYDTTAGYRLTSWAGGTVFRGAEHGLTRAVCF